MKNILKFSAFIAVVILLIVMYRSKFSTRQEVSADTLIVGTNAEFAPFTFIEADNIVGFDIDLIKEVGKRLNKKTILKDMPFETLLPELQMGKIHMIAAGMTPTQERAKKVLFSKAYLEGEPLVVVSLKVHPAITSLDDLVGKKVIVNDGFTADYYMSAYEGPDLIRLPTTAEAMLALRNGNAYAYVTAYTPVKSFIEKNITEFSIFPIEGTRESTAFGISKEYPSLVPQVDQALDEIEKDGTLGLLKKKWGL